MRFLKYLMVVALLWPAVAQAYGDSCTDGTDCYCDTQSDPNLIMCEDFEARTLRGENHASDVGNGAPNYGPPYDEVTLNFRGNNGYLKQVYGPPVPTCGWNGTGGDPDPASPKHGNGCTLGNCDAKVYDFFYDNDEWDGDDGACLGFVKSGDFNQLVTGITAPTQPWEGYSVAHIIEAGEPHKHGIWGHSYFTTVYELGITYAVAYPSNSITSGIWVNPWKGNEFGSKDSALTIAHNQGSGIADEDPFYWSNNLAESPGPTFKTACDSEIAGANLRRGKLSCTNNTLYYGPDTAEGYYARSGTGNPEKDWPLGKWGCVRAHITNMNSDNWGVKIWFMTEDDTTETLIIDFDGIDDRVGGGMDTAGGIASLSWNAFANANQVSPPGTPTTETTYRYEDNMHLTNGTPVSCASIGFDGSSPATTPEKGVSFSYFREWAAVIGIGLLLLVGLAGVAVGGRWKHA